jgi:hypothetical protein
MKLSPLVVLLGASALLAACNSLDNPLRGMNLLGTGHDGRVYNPQTGEFEWPKDATSRPGRTRKASELSAALKATPAPAPKSDGRYYDAQKSQWVEPPPQSNAGLSPNSKSKPRSAAAATPAPSPLPAAAPSTPAPARARGVYNPSSGKIEWQSSDGPPAATPAPRKRWWLF